MQSSFMTNLYLRKEKNGFNYVSVTGYCTEYNEVGAVIQAHHNLKCENVKPPCFSSYISTEAYHCKILSISFLSLSFTQTITGNKCMFSKVFLYHFFNIMLFKDCEHISLAFKIKPLKNTCTYMYNCIRVTIIQLIVDTTKH